MPDNDPDMDAVLQSSAAPASMGDADMDAVLQPQAATNPSLWDRYLGFQESQLHGLTGGIGSMAGGVGYLGSLAETGSPEKAAATMRETQDALTYQPRTAEGKRQSGEMTAAAASLGQAPGETVGGATTDALSKLGLPPSLAAGAGATINTAMNIPQLALGIKGSEELGKGIVEPPAPIPSASEAILKKGQDLGLVVPPSTANPTAFNKLSEGAVGKLSTAQSASIKNQPIIDSLARKDFGLPEEAELTPETMAGIRAEQSPAYEAVKSIPQIPLGPKYAKALGSLTESANKISAELPDYKATGSQQVQDLVKSLQPPSGSVSGTTAVELSKSLRAEASSLEAKASRSLDPADKALARANRGAATALEDAVEDHLQSIGQGDVASAWDNARRTIAKTYSVQDALDGAGHVDAAKLGKQSIRGKPLSDNLETIADFANTFPKAANLKWSKESVPGLSPLDVYGGAGLGLAAGLESGHATAAISGAAIPLARMGGRAALLSGPGQRLAVPSKPGTPGSIVTPLGQVTIPGLTNPSQDRDIAP